MPQRHVPRYVQQAYSSTHKTLLRWCFLESCNGGGSASLQAFILAAARYGGCKNLEIVL
jgi:hypothetical protein